MAPRLDFSNWWPKEAKKGTPVVLKMENPNYSVVEINGPDAAFRPVEKSRGKNAKQVTWVLLLKAHHAVGCVAWIASLFWVVLEAIKKRLIFRQDVAMASEKMGKGKLLFTFIEVFLVTSLAILGFEVVAYLKGWHYFQNTNLHIPRSSDFQGCSIWFMSLGCRFGQITLHHRFKLCLNSLLLCSSSNLLIV